MYKERIIHNPQQQPISRRTDIHIGNRVRFAFPEYSHDIHSTLQYLSMNKVYTIKDFNVSGEFIQLYLNEISDYISFNSMQFVPEWTNYKVRPYCLKYIKYGVKRLKKKCRCF